MHEYEFPRPALTADVALFCGDEADRRVLLIRRGAEPFLGNWALPGGFVDEGEVVEAAARRELAEETGIAWTGSLVQAGAFADPGRDPRGWTATMVYTAWVGEVPLRASAGDDAAEAEWHEVRSLPPLAFDHNHVIVRCAAELKLRGEW